MAINKEINTKIGVKARYWNIGYVKIFGRKTLTTIGRIDGYYNQEAYDNGAEPIDKINFSTTDFTKADTLSYGGIYQFIKASIEVFKESQDILEESEVVE